MTSDSFQPKGGSMSTIPRKARGPRTPIESAQDAARKAATIIEDTPPSYLKDDYLEPVATLLRFWFGSASERRAEEAEKAFAGVVDRLRSGWHKWGDNEELFSRPATTTEELLAGITDDLHELVRRLDNYAAGDVDEETANAGLVLAAKADAVLSWARSQAFSVRHGLERKGWRT
jgi:hypothetical protein